jgi:hypothetical protein
MSSNEATATQKPDLSGIKWERPEGSQGQIPRRAAPERGSFWRTLRYYLPTIIIVGIAFGVGCGSPILEAIGESFPSNRTQTIYAPICGTWKTTTNPFGLQSQSTRLTDIAAVSNDDVWVIGYRAIGEAERRLRYDEQLFLHWDGKDFRTVPAMEVQYDSILASLQATAPADNEWKIRPPEVEVLSEYATSCCKDSSISHWDGTSWIDIPGPRIPRSYFSKIVAMSTAPNRDIWVVGWAEFEDWDDYIYHVPFVAHFVRCSNSTK